VALGRFSGIGLDLMVAIETPDDHPHAARFAFVCAASFSPEPTWAARSAGWGRWSLFAVLAAEIAGRFTGTLATAGAEFDDTQTIPARAGPPVHRTRPGHRRGVWRRFPTPPPLAGVAECCRRFVRCPHEGEYAFDCQVHIRRCGRR
jgi:hypothetical protein